jgi:CubicO group peptidase (beta-lactamase class C family)
MKITAPIRESSAPGERKRLATLHTGRSAEGGRVAWVVQEDPANGCARASVPEWRGPGRLQVGYSRDHGCTGMNGNAGRGFDRRGEMREGLIERRGRKAVTRRSFLAPAWVVAALPMLLLVIGCTPDGAGGEGVRIAVEDSSVRAGIDREAVRTVGLDSVTVAAAFDRASELPRLRSLVVGRHGEIVQERSFRGPSLTTPVNVKSVSKSVLSAAIGIAIADGYLGGADQPIAEYFAGQLEADPDPRKLEITVGHLLSMQSGLERTSGGNYGRWVTSPNWVRYAITRPMVAAPGDAMQYSTGNSHLLSAVLTRATGRSTWAYMRDRLAWPLEIELPRWPTDPQGIYFGGNDMRMSPRDMFRFGELYRNGGRAGDVQVVPEWWVSESLTPRTRSPWSGERYGYGWFLSEVRGYPMFYAWGYGGQFIFVVPDLELTVVTTSDPESPRERGHLQAVRRLLSEWIVPAAEVGAGPAGPHMAGDRIVSEGTSGGS